MNILKQLMPVLLPAALIMPVANGQTPKMMMNTEIPPSVITPDKMETSIGT